MSRPRGSSRLRANITIASGCVLMITGISYIVYPRITAALPVVGRHASLYEQSSVIHSADELNLGRPIRIELPRLGIERTILGGTYDPVTRTWTLDKEHAFFMRQSRTPIIYGHNIKTVFKPLAKVANGELMTVTNADGDLLHFRYTGDRHIPPTEDSLLRENSPRTLYLMTCSGPRSTTRRILNFEYIGELSGAGTQLSKGKTQ